jgi:guanylate kinase
MDSSNTSYRVQLSKELTPEEKIYLDSNAELHRIISKLLFAAIEQKPTDAHKFTEDYFCANKQPETIYKPLVISGPSGVGKGTIIKKLLQNFPNLFKLSVSYTTRKPRAGEENGVHYHFAAPEEFSAEIAKDSFIEFTEVHGNFYGTHRGYVKQIMEQKKICILEIDVVGAQKISKSGQDCNYLFIEPPSMEELRNRLDTRGTDSEDVKKLRMTNAIVELEMAKNFGIYNRFITNIEIDQTYSDIIEYINQNYFGLNLKA